MPHKELLPLVDGNLGAQVLLNRYEGKPLAALWKALIEGSSDTVCMSIVKDLSCGIDKRSTKSDGDIRTNDGYIAYGREGLTPLALAALSGRIEVLLAIIKLGAMRDEESLSTALFQSVAAGRLDSLFRLIENGANMNRLLKDNKTLLHIAARYQKLKVMNVLCENNAKVDVVDKDGTTPLHAAAAEGFAAGVAYLFSKGAKLDVCNVTGSTPLMLATIKPHEDAMQVLIECGADVNKPDKLGFAPLHFAAGHHQLEPLRLLLQAGANPNVQNTLGRTPLHFASTDRYSAFSRDASHVKELIGCGANPSVGDKDGKTPLHLAAKAQNWEISLVLVTAGARLDVRDREGQTPLFLAVFSAEEETDRLCELVSLMLTEGAEVNAKANKGTSIMQIVAKKYLLKIQKLLLDEGADTQDLDVKWCV